MITQPIKPVRSVESVKSVKPVEPVKPAGPNVAAKPGMHGKSNPANAIKKSATGIEKSPNSTSGLKNPGPIRQELSSVVKSPSGEYSVGKAIPAKELFMKTAANMGLPKDALSVAILVFARYFSVSLSPALMKTLRREILASGKSSSPTTQAEKAALEAETLSALVALDKGVELSPQALEHYARFLSFPDENPGRQNQKEDRDPDRNCDRDREESPSAEELRILSEEQGQNNGALAFLNQLPGKNGQHWLVFPFNIMVKGIEFQVFLRLLKKEPVSFGEDGHLHLIVDITGPKRRWRCFLKKIDEEFMADLRVYPMQSPRALKILQKEAEQILKEGRALFGSFKGFGEILVRNGEEAPSWADDFCTESLPSIDEAI
jgi:hypothetical protein